MARQVRLVGLSGEYGGSSFPITKDETLIGRGEDCDLQIVDERISRHHAQLRQEGETWTLEDLDSTHGTFVKGERIEKAVLQYGDTITLGETVLRFEQHPGQDDIPTVMASPDDIVTVMDVGDGPPATIPSPDEILTQLASTGDIRAVMDDGEQAARERCRHCGAVMAPDEKYCGECGQPIQEDKADEPVPAPPTRKAEGMPAAVPLVRPPIVAPPAPPPERKAFPWKWVAIGGGILIALSVIGIGLSLIPGLLDEEMTAPDSGDIVGLETSPVEIDESGQVTPLIPATLTPTAEVAATLEVAGEGPPATDTPGVETPTTGSVTAFIGGAIQVAFASDRTGRPQIFLINLETLEEKQLTDLSGGACQPAWSPDGSRVAYTSPCNTNREEYSGSSIYTLDVDAAGNPGAVSQLVSMVGGGDYDPAWSRDGNRIAFTSWRTGRPHIFTVNPDGSDLRNLNDDLAFNWAPTWAGDGSQLAFLTGRGGQEEIWTIQAGGGEERRFSRSDGKDVARPDWSPDGSTIVFEKIVGNIPRLIAAPVADGGVRELQVCQRGQLSLQPMREPTWSPDGGWLAFETWPDGVNHEIAVMRASCSDYAELTSDSGLDFDAAWRPVR